MGDIEQFTDNVKQLISLQDRMKQISLQAKEARTPVKDEYDTLQANVIQFMKTRDVHVCNYQEDKLELHSVVRTGSFTKKTVLAGLVSFFGGNEEQAQECMDHIISTLGTRELDILKRVKKRQPRKSQARKKKAPVVEEEEVYEEEEDEQLPEQISDDE